MAQYWLQTPIENAKEVVQRFIDDNISTFPNYQNKKVTYTENCEVIYYYSILPSDLRASDEILFGTWYLPAYEDNLQAVLSDTSGSITTLNTGSGFDSGAYPYIIWNYLNDTPNTLCYFVGYKFKLV